MSFINLDQPIPGVTRISLNRPERMNAMAFDVMVPLRETIEKIAYDNDTRVVILTGTGTGFCSGADLEDPGDIPHIDGLSLPTIALRSMELLDNVIKAIRKLHQPVIAQVNGPAIGGGFCLALACDIRIASDNAYFRAAGINNGLTAAELGLSYLLPRTIGFGRATEIMLTGRDIDANEAVSLGIVTKSVSSSDLEENVFRVANQIIGWSRAGIELTKRALWNGLESNSMESHMDAEGIAQLFVRITTKNFEESIRARRDKRPPNFVD